MHIKSIKNFVPLILTSLFVLSSLEAVVSPEVKTDKTLLNHQSVNRNVTSTSSSLVASPSSSRSSVDADEEEEEGEGEDVFEEEVTDEEGTGLESTSGPSSTSSSPGNEEEKPPDLPTALHAKATASNIHVTWMPPKDRKTVVRGYTIGWGVGVPDVYSKVLDPKTRSFTISDLKPQVEYVISLRAYNNMGDGQPAYASLRTLAADTEEGVTTIFPPVGLKANILSSSTVVLQWTDSGRQTTATDNRQYVIRYTSNFRSVSPKYKFGYSNRTTLMIDGLKPATQYEFSVKVVKGKTESTWSMSVINSTLDASPSSPPRDLTIVSDEDNASAVRLHWQPPKYPNGQITGYIILYTTDETRPEREWSVHPLVGDKMNTMITDMLPDTLYFFKIQAKNEKGSGPVSSPAVSFRTLALSSASTTNLLRKGPSVTSSVTSSSSTEPIYITMIAVVSVVTLVLIFIVTLILCRGYNRKSSSTAKYSAAATSPRSSSRNNKNRASRELNPPDLWIHHDQLELKSLDKNQDPDLTPTPVLRTFQDPLLTSCNSVSPAPPPSLNSSLGLVGGIHGGPCGHSSVYDDVNRGISVPSPASSVDHHHSNQLSIFPPASNTNTSTIRRTGRAKPIMIPAESVGILSTSGNNTASTAFDSSTILRPVYPVNGRNSYNIHGTLSKGNGGSHQLNCYEVNNCNLYDPVTGLSSSGVGMTMSLLHTTSFPTPAPTLSSSNVSYSSPTHSGNSASGGGGSINSPTMSDQPPPPPSLNHTHLHHHHLQQHQYQNHQHHCLTTSSPSMNNLAPSGTRMPLTLQTPLRSYDIHSSSCTPSSSSTSSSSTCANNSQQANNVTPKQIAVKPQMNSTTSSVSSSSSSLSPLKKLNYSNSSSGFNTISGKPTPHIVNPSFKDDVDCFSTHEELSRELDGIMKNLNAITNLDADYNGSQS